MRHLTMLVVFAISIVQADAQQLSTTAKINLVRLSRKKLDANASKMMVAMLAIAGDSPFDKDPALNNQLKGDYSFAKDRVEELFIEKLWYAKYTGKDDAAKEVVRALAGERAVADFEDTGRPDPKDCHGPAYNPQADVFFHCRSDDDAVNMARVRLLKAIDTAVHVPAAQGELNQLMLELSVGAKEGAKEADTGHARIVRQLEEQIGQDAAATYLAWWAHITVTNEDGPKDCPGCTGRRPPGVPEPPADKAAVWWGAIHLNNSRSEIIEFYNLFDREIIGDLVRLRSKGKQAEANAALRAFLEAINGPLDISGWLGGCGTFDDDNLPDNDRHRRDVGDSRGTLGRRLSQSVENQI